MYTWNWGWGNWALEVKKRILDANSLKNVLFLQILLLKLSSFANENHYL